MKDVSRRRAVKLTATAGAIAALGTSDAIAQEAGDYKGKLYSGTSKKGDFKEALDLAIKAALDSAPGADRQAKWTLEKISGVNGGITATRELTVTIKATIV